MSGGVQESDRARVVVRAPNPLAIDRKNSHRCGKFRSRDRRHPHGLAVDGDSPGCRAGMSLAPYWCKGLDRSAALARLKRPPQETAMVKFHRILCPLDFSEFSRHALDRAAAIAKAHGAAITALHVAPIPVPVAPMPLEMPIAVPAPLTAVQLDRARRELADFARLDPALAVPVDCEVVEAPVVHDEIVAQAARLRADLIVMGTHGRSGFQRLFLGSVAEKVLRLALPPVLTVGAPADGRSEPFSRILCGIDFSDCSLAALDYALGITGGANAKVTVVNVIEWTPVGYDPLIGPPTDFAGYRMSAETRARERLHRAVAHRHAPGVEINKIVTSGKPHHELLRLAKEEEADLIVLGIHGRNPIDRLVFGSTAEPVVRHATCPVLTVRVPFTRIEKKPSRLHAEA
jgi:nucleotide-binding universal stress UspA family protein